MLIDMNSMSLTMISEKADMIQPTIAMNSADLAGQEGSIAANTVKVGGNMTNLAGISPTASDNAAKAGTPKGSVDMNSELIGAFDGVIINNSNGIAPLSSRATSNTG